MQVIASLQYRENYGYRWKFKGGDSVIFPYNNQSNEEIEAILKDAGFIWKNEMSEQYLIGWEVVCSDWKFEIPSDLADYVSTEKEKEDYIKCFAPKPLKLPVG